MLKGAEKLGCASFKKIYTGVEVLRHSSSCTAALKTAVCYHNHFLASKTYVQLFLFFPIYALIVMPCIKKPL